MGRVKIVTTDGELLTAVADHRLDAAFWKAIEAQRPGVQVTEIHFILDEPVVVPGEPPKFRPKVAIKTARKHGIVTAVHGDHLEYVWHNGMKPRHGIALLSACEVISREQMLAHIKRTGHTALRSYL